MMIQLKINGKNRSHKTTDYNLISALKEHVMYLYRNC